jgi:protein-tyrosine sulfotransferase
VNLEPHYKLSSKFRIRNSELRLASDSRLSAWSRANRKYLPVPLDLLKFVSEFKSDGKAVTLEQAIKSFSKKNDLSDSEKRKLMGSVPKLVDCGLIERVDGFVLRELEHESSHADRAFSPVLLIGCPRSGTTLLGWLLNSHPNIACSSESWILESIIKIAKDPFYDTPVKGFFQRSDQLGLSPEEVLASLGRWVDQVLSDFAERKGKRRWVEKTLYSWQELDFVDRVLDYRCKYIFMHRHAFDVAYSISSGMAAIPKEFRTSGLQLENAVRWWVAYNATLLRMKEKHPERCILIGYDELVRRPTGIMKKILRFLGEDYSSSIWDEFKKGAPPDYTSGDTKILHTGGRVVDSRKVNQWKTWDKALIRQMAEIANDMLKKLGYKRIYR